MNIQRYKWPVLVAAGLHGALFFSAPHSSIGGIRTKGDRGSDLPPIPKVELVEIDQPDPELTSEAKPDSGGPAVKELPDVAMPLPDKVSFTIPVVDHAPAKIGVETLKDYTGGPPGPGTESVPTAGTGIFRPGQLDRVPRATAQMSPEYPSAMSQQGIAGTVTVEFDVNAEGRVVRASVVRTSRREFSEPALRAVRNWHFEPGKRNGRAVPFRMTVPIEFGLGAN